MSAGCKERKRRGYTERALAAYSPLKLRNKRIFEIVNCFRWDKFPAMKKPTPGQQKHNAVRFRKIVMAIRKCPGSYRRTEGAPDKPVTPDDRLTEIGQNKLPSAYLGVAIQMRDELRNYEQSDERDQAMTAVITLLRMTSTERDVLKFNAKEKANLGKLYPKPELKVIEARKKAKADKAQPK